MGTSSGAYELEHDRLCLYNALALVFLIAYIDRMLFGYADCKGNKHRPIY